MHVYSTANADPVLDLRCVNPSRAILLRDFIAGQSQHPRGVKYCCSAVSTDNLYNTSVDGSTVRLSKAF